MQAGGGEGTRPRVESERSHVVLAGDILIPASDKQGRRNLKNSLPWPAPAVPPPGSELPSVSTRDTQTLSRLLPCPLPSNLPRRPVDPRPHPPTLAKTPE